MNQLFRNFRSVFFCLILLGYGAGFAQANPPQRVNFQGRLTDLSNNPLNGTFTLIFSLYNVPTGGTALWTETQAGVSVENGAVESVLGSVTPIPYSVAASSSAYLQIQVGAEVLSPRQPFNSVLYSMNTYQLAGKSYDAFVDTSTAQTIAGIKTFSANPVFNADSIAQGMVNGLTASLAAKAAAATVAADTTTLKAQLDSKPGDSLGNHIATASLNMAGFNINNITSVTAANFYGNGAGLSGISGDNLGNHTATQNLNMGVYGVITSSNITAARYYGDGSSLTNVNSGQAVQVAADTTTIANDLVAEANDRGNADLALGGKFGAVATDTTTIANNLLVEVTDRGNADIALGGRFVTVAMDTTTIANNLVTEVTDRGNADLALGGRFGAVAADTTTIANNLVTEVTDRGNADLALGGKFGAVAMDTTTIANNLVTEATSRGNADLALGAKFGTVAIDTTSLKAQLDGIAGDNLGSHTAAATLNMAGFMINNVSTISATNSIFTAGDMVASKFIGNGSGLTGISGDGLGNHIATTSLNMSNYSILNVGSMMAGAINATRYQIAGSTVLAILPNNSLSVGVAAGNDSTGNNNAFVGAGAGAFNTTGANNVFVGQGAGNLNATGNANTIVGMIAGYNNTGSNNTFVGQGAGYYNAGGASNSFFGLYAGNANNTGNQNTSVGMYAGRNNQTGSANAIFGYGAGYGVTSNSFSNSTLMGYQAGYGLTTGSGNILMGYQAGYNITTGMGNIVIGYAQNATEATANNQLNIGGVLYGDLSAKNIGISTRAPQAALDVMTTNASPSSPTQLWRRYDGAVVATMTAVGTMSAAAFQGNGSMLTGITGDNLGSHTAAASLNMANFPINNVSTITAVNSISAAGYQIGGNTVLAISPDNMGVSVGREAGKVSTGEGGTYVGYTAGYQNTTGAYNTFVGGHAGFANTTAERNTFLGYYSGAANNIGTRNTFVGVQAGQSNTMGNFNTFVGANTGGTNTTGEENTFVGVSVGGANTTGSYNSFLGNMAGLQNTTGTENVFLGYYTGIQNTIGNKNTFVGTNAGYNNTTGVDNSAMGYMAGHWNQTGSANAIFGNQAAGGAGTSYSFSKATLMGYQSGYGLTTGNDNILLGYRAGYNINTGTGNIIIGYNNTAPSAGTNYHLNIGNAIYGDLSTGNVGIGTTTAGAKLEVAGQVKITGGTPGAGKVLTSDSAGLAAWQTVSGDNLGNHIATSSLNMANFSINNVSSITAIGDIAAARYQIAGSPVLAVLPGGSLGVGVNAGSVNTGAANSFVGAGAGQANTTGEYNSFIGAGAGNNNTEGGGNSFIGRYTGYLNTTGGDNSFVGNEAGVNNGTGASNTFVGANAGQSNTTGDGNSFVGSYAGLFTGGSANAIFGSQAGGYNDASNSGSFSSSTLMGYGAGYYLGTGSADNIFVGFMAGRNVTTGKRNIIIGYEQNAPLATTNDHLNIGGVIYGNLATGKVGIGTQSPSADLQIQNAAGTAEIGLSGPATSGAVTARISFNNATIESGVGNPMDQSYLALFTKASGSGMAERVRISSVGAVGFGTSDPQAMLDVVSTGTAADVYAQLWRDSSGAIVSSVSATGVIAASRFVGDGSGLKNIPSDNLGSHIATTTLNMAWFPIANVSTVTMGGTGLTISTGVSANSNGLYITHTGGLYTLGYGGSGSTYLPAARGYGSVDLQSYRVLGADRVAAGTYSTIAGGIDNKIIAGTVNSFIGAGDRNTFTAGVQNSVIVGGYNNIMGGSHAFIGGGYGNAANHAYISIPGGMSNIAGSQYTSITGGFTNTIDTFSDKAVILGGSNNSVSNGFYALAGGFYARSNAYGAFTWSDSQGQPLDNNVADRTVFKNRGGFLITGSTDTAISGTMNRGVFITGDGRVGISTGSPQAALDVVSAGTYAQIWRNAVGTIVSSMTETGVLYPKSAVAGDDLGNHTATTALNMATFDIVGVSTIAVNGRVGIGTANPNNRLQVVDYVNFDDTLYNTMLGYRAGYQTTAGWNMFVGHQAGYANIGGTDNVALGKNALFMSVSGNENTAVGNYALGKNSGGSRNTALGNLAGGGENPTNYSDNTLLGYRAGYALSTGGTNIMVGSFAGSNVTTGAGNIIIGYNLLASSTTTSNTLNIGGVIYGDLSAKTATIPRYTTQASDNGVTLTSSDFGKTITVNSVSTPQTVTLPDVTAADIGAQVTVIKLGAAQVTIQVTGSGVSIADSVSGGNITNNVSAENYASITLRLASAMKWIITGGNGSWTTN
ncbi:MAG: hypothetical protein Q7R35_19825 [Elusimicrobiota bacterium]|nr:hypothetical protein [Elusimicrobiota bacterium]